MNTIKEFQGEYRWLSNFAPVKITLDNIEYPSVEHAYMSAKSNDINWKHQCANTNKTPGQIKRLSRAIRLIANWDETKLKVMALCLHQKFNQEPYKSKLKNTVDAILQEGNNWGDEFWGINLKTGKGQNNLGQLIMNIRAGLS